MTVETNNSAILQARVPDALRGRVIGLFALMYTGVEPLGALGVGVLAERTSAPFTVGVCALGLLCYALLIFVWRPEVREVA